MRLYDLPFYSSVKWLRTFIEMLQSKSGESALGSVTADAPAGAPAVLRGTASGSSPQLATDSVGAEPMSRPGSQIELSLRPWAEAPDSEIESRASAPPSPTISPKDISVREKRARSERSESPPAASSDVEEYTQGRAQVVAVLGSAISDEVARLLLRQHSGDVERAVNAFYDGFTEKRVRGSTGEKVNPAKPQPTPKVRQISWQLPRNSQ